MDLLEYGKIHHYKISKGIKRMPNYKLTIAYDGTEYCGFQVQPNGPTVQGALMKAAIDLFGHDVTVTGASRTDSGVHARGQVAALKAEKAIEARKIPMAMNVRLPDDIVIVDCKEVPGDWHPRYCTHRKTYEYRIYNGPVHYPHDKRHSYHCRKPLNLALMKQAAKLMVGTHDFESYSSAGKSVEDTVRTIYDISLSEVESMIYLKVTGNGFLYNMVRIIAGTLMEAGQDKRSLETIAASLEIRDRTLSGVTAPAKGLTLLSIQYDD